MVGDEADVSSLANALAQDRYDVARAGTGEQARFVIGNGPLDAILTSEQLLDGAGRDVLEIARAKDVNLSVVLLSANNTSGALAKSLREGFGLTVAEALWKGKPVVASAVGGIPTQIIHKHTGLLAHSIEGTAYQIRFLLSHPEIASKLGEQGHEHVKENFLITQNLRNYLALFLSLIRAGETVA